MEVNVPSDRLKNFEIVTSDRFCQYNCCLGGCVAADLWFQGKEYKTWAVGRKHREPQATAAFFIPARAQPSSQGGRLSSKGTAPSYNVTAPFYTQVKQ